MDTTNTTGNIDNNTTTETKMKGKQAKGKQAKATAEVTAPAGFTAGAVQRVEPSGTSTVPAGDYTIFTTRNAAGKEVKRIIHEGRVSVVKSIKGRLVACKDFEKSGKYADKGEKVRVDLRGLREALATFQEAGGNATAEIATLTATLAQRTATLTEQKAALATIQAQVAERVAAAMASGQGVDAILAALATPAVTTEQ